MDVQFFSLGMILVSAMKYPRDIYEVFNIKTIRQLLADEENQ